MTTNNPIIYENEIYKLYFDGCSKSNPGKSGSGSVIYDVNNNEIWTDSYYVGDKQTNNFAEYTGLYRGMKKAIEIGIKKLEVYGDSKLVIKQMKGEYSTKSLNLIDISNECKKIANEFDEIKFNHVYRNNNKRADELSNVALCIFIAKNNKLKNKKKKT